MSYTYTALKTCLPKVAVFIETVVDGKKTYALVTQNKHIIDQFNSEKTNFIYRCSDQQETIMAYELRHDEVVTLHVKNITLYMFCGIPYSITPPMFINPDLEGTVTNEQLLEAQAPFIDKVKHERDRGLYIKQDFAEEKLINLIDMKGFFEETLNAPLSSHSIFDIYKEPELYHYNLVSNTKDGNFLIDLYHNMYFLPLIIVCQNEEDKTPTHYLPKYISGEIFNGLKDKWLNYLETTRVNTLAKKTEEFNKLDDIYREKFSQSVVTALKGFPNLNVSIEPFFDSNYKYQLSQKAFDDLHEFYLQHPDVEHNFTLFLKFLEIPEDVIQRIEHGIATQPEKSKDDITKTKMGFDIVLNEHQKLKEQYQYLITKLSVMNIEEILRPFDSHKLYLRYWPELFDHNIDLHRNIRPFTDLEIQVITYFIKQGIEFDLNELYKKEYDYYNSAIDILEKYIDQVREKRLQQIIEISNIRGVEIKAEIDQIYSTLPEEEQKQFDDILKDILDIDKYRNEVYNESKLIGVLSYWPAALYPAPDDTIQT